MPATSLFMSQACSGPSHVPAVFSSEGSISLLSWPLRSKRRGSQLRGLGDGAGTLISGFSLVFPSLRSNSLILMRTVRQLKVYEDVHGVTLEMEDEL